MRKFNVPDLPIRLTQSILTKGRRDHHLSASDMNDIALNVQTPIAVFKSKRGDGNIVLVTEARHAEGNVVVAMQLEITPPGHHITINDIRTIYPRPDSEVHVWVDAGLLLGYEKRKGRNWLADSGGYDSRRTQAKATFEAAIVYSTDHLRNPPDPADSDIRFSRSGTAPSPSLLPLRDRMERITDSLIYNFQDRFKPLHDIQKRLVPATEEEDAVLAEELYSGIVRARTNDFHQLDRPRA